MTAALVGLICVAASAVILVTLHFAATGLDPISYAVSDYGWTSYHLGYRTMVVLQGIGAILIAVGLGQETDARTWIGRAGPTLWAHSDGSSWQRRSRLVSRLSSHRSDESRSE